MIYNKNKFMNISIYRYIVFLSVILLAGCSFLNAEVSGKDINKLSMATTAADTIDDVEALENNDSPDQEEAVEQNVVEYEDCEIIYSDDKGVEKIKPVQAVEDKKDRKKTGNIAEQAEKARNILDAALDFCNASQEFWAAGNIDEALSTLDHAYALVLKVDTDAYPELLQQKEDLRFMISKRILEIYASRYTAVSGNHNEIPLIMNEHVEKEIRLFQGPERDFFIESYKRSGRYMDNIVKALDEAGLPRDLAWLPLIESGFKSRALSSARALGLWQFIPSTGYKFGLKRDTWIDERLDSEKATAAAIAYMKELHLMFGDWMTVLAGYNCGENAVLRRIREQKVNYLDNFWDLYQQLPRETARYVPRFLATLHIIKNPAKYGFDLEQPYAPLSYESVSIQKPVQLSVVAKEIDVPAAELSDLNVELRQQITPETPYLLRVPVGKGDVLLANLDKIPEWSPPKNAFVYHRVKRGETLSTIAMKYRMSVSGIRSANNIRRDLIHVGQKLKIPLTGNSGRNLRVSGALESEVSQESEYQVRKGDSLSLIARKFNTDTKSLQKINKLTSANINVGQVLRVTR